MADNLAGTDQTECFSFHDNAQPMKNKVVLITQADFWNRSYGLAARVFELVRFLAPRFDLSIALLGNLTEKDLQRVREMCLDFNLYLLGESVPVQLSPQAQRLLENFRRYFNESSPPATYIVVKTENSFMLEGIPANGRKMLDTNDLISARTKSMQQHNAPAHFPLTEGEELEIFRRYDSVVCIQPVEYAWVCARLGAEKTILAQHPIAAKRTILRKTVASIGIVASRWHANVDGLNWFIERVWPHFQGRNLTLDVYGMVCQELSRREIPGMQMHGFMEYIDACYAHIDIAINPVRYGAGLKIKSVEAMAWGLPLVASVQGASGLEELAGQAFLLARDEREFIAAIESMLQNIELRRSIGRAACAYVAEHLSAERCFGELAKHIVA